MTLWNQSKPRRRNPITVVIVVVLLAVVLSFAAFEYSSAVADSIQSSSVEAVQTNTQIQASDMDHILLDEFNTVASNLQILAVSHVVETKNATEATPLFDAAVASTAVLTSQYFWINQHGDLVLVRNATGPGPSPPAGSNLTQRPYFIGAEETGSIFFTTLIPSLNNQSVINIAFPIYSQNSSRAFEGVVGAAINLPGMGEFLQSQVSPQFKSSIGLLDSKGTILYSRNEALLGQNIFGSEVQSLIPSSLRSTFNIFINSSLEGSAGVGEVSYEGSSSTIAYQPVLIPSADNQSKPEEFGVLYITAPDMLAASQDEQIGQLRVLTAAVVVGIAAVCVTAGAIILRWNRRLDAAVKERTSDLVLANDQLRQRTEELARANMEIASQADVQRDLFNITAHELRTPTQSILANAELMHDALQPVIDSSGSWQPSSSSGGQGSPAGGAPSEFTNAELSNLAASTYRNAQRLQKLIQNILNVVRIENKTLQLDLETVDLDEKIRNVIKDTRNIVESNGRHYSDYNIVFEPDVPLLPVRADRTKLYEIISNLIRNAVTHSKEGGTIRVTAKPSDGFAVISVSDEGSGIDPEVFSRLFTKFATKSGTGLGLFISKSYVEAHGGKIWAENNPDGRGATFTFTLPLEPEAGKKDAV
jgi:signal transduction histidine kinase